MKKNILGLAVVFFLMFVVAGCSDNPAKSDAQVVDSGQTLYLLGMDGDPIGLEGEAPSSFDFHFRDGFRGRYFGHDSDGEAAFCMDGIGRLTEALGLTDDQIAQIEVIADKYKASFDELRDAWDSGTSWQEIRDQRKALHDAFIEEIKPILTDAQIALLEEMQSKFEQGKFPEDMATRRLAWLTETLNLTTEQQDQISALLVAASEQLIALRDASESREAFHEAAQSVLETLNQSIAELLDADQLELYNQFPMHPRWQQGWHHRH